MYLAGLLSSQTGLVLIYGSLKDEKPVAWNRTVCMKGTFNYYVTCAQRPLHATKSISTSELQYEFNYPGLRLLGFMSW